MSGGLSSPELFDRWLAEEVRKAKRAAFDEAIVQVIPTIRCDSEDITWVSKNPYRVEDK
jgi:hypothetical protein